MFERFSHEARRALFFSRLEASELGDSVIDSEHILLGILREEDDITRDVLDHFGVDRERLRAEFSRVSDSAPVSLSAEMPVAEKATRIFVYASGEAERSGTAYVTPHMLLLALLRMPESRAAQVLTSFGVSYVEAAEIADRIRRKLRDA